MNQRDITVIPWFFKPEMIKGESFSGWARM